MPENIKPEAGDPPLVLASASPRRRDLLARESVRFEVIPADIPEEARPDEAPAEFASRLAGEKALAVAARLGSDPPRWVLGADTIVVIDGDILGKPTDARNAEHLLGRLVGRTHSVITAFALTHSGDGTLEREWIESRVTMRAASAEEIRSYVETGEPMDKAGAYAVQGIGGTLVEKVVGSLDNVIGLPVAEVLATWARLRETKLREKRR
jgi:septum formation protein